MKTASTCLKTHVHNCKNGGLAKGGLLFWVILFTLFLHMPFVFAVSKAKVELTTSVAFTEDLSSAKIVSR